MRKTAVTLLVLETLLAVAADSGTNQIPRHNPEHFQPVHYRPIPAEVPGLGTNIVSLDVETSLCVAPAAFY